ncbi:uncharacterized protein BP5553_02880 [Venustampulla echinocandica]|uniref:Uncharacterized protein n=1 Tax=Venustampulla echinocandica TaxID=2656787 RepID=A0A370TSN6_9HELO|nr:uncharacterized protein BP5553_02880 [Venustampulla echinocandica]RDL38540.1 hypothetical protein BP5553_02880 [Venustampulla echinocandica]
MELYVKILAIGGALWFSRILLSIWRFIYIYARPSSLPRYHHHSKETGSPPWAIVTGASDGIGKGCIDIWGRKHAADEPRAGGAEGLAYHGAGQQCGHGNKTYRPCVLQLLERYAGGYRLADQHECAVSRAAYSCAVAAVAGARGTRAGVYNVLDYGDRESVFGDLQRDEGVHGDVFEVVDEGDAR